MKRIITLLLAASTIGALTACGSAEPTSGTEVAVETEVVETEEVDLGGMEIVLAGWGDIVEPKVKSSAQQEAMWEYRHDIMEKYNFTFEQKGLAGWNELLELLSTSTMAGDPAAELFRIHVNFLETAKNSGLLYDLATLKNIDVHDPKWGKPLTEKMTSGDAVYAVSPQESPLMCIYFNKRIFEEAGLDPNILYDLQASGEWTWDKFWEISNMITQDVDNDGVNDIYAINCNTYFFAQAAIFSNGGSYVGRNADGTYFNNTSSPETVEALEWSKRYWDTDNEIIPEHWDGHRALFTSGKIGMYLSGAWEASVFTQEAMPDDWGLVAFPKGPSADTYTSLYSFDGYVIPASFSKEEAEAIAFAYNMWTNPTPGYEGKDDWKTVLYPVYRDERAIEETLTMLKNSSNPQLDHSSILYSAGIIPGTIGSDVYWDKMTVKEAIESREFQWQAEIDKINSAIEN